MSVHQLNTLGFRCPEPILKVAVKAAYMKPGDILEVRGDCPTFERDVRTWCERLHKVFLAMNEEEEGRKRIQIQF